MSENEETKVLNALRSVDKLIPLVRGLLVGAFAIGVWVATIEIRGSQQAAQVAHHTEDLDHLKIWKAGTEANRFTSADWAKYAAIMADAANQTDKRLTRTEDAVGRIEKAVERIEKKIDPQKP